MLETFEGCFPDPGNPKSLGLSEDLGLSPSSSHSLEEWLWAGPSPSYNSFLLLTLSFAASVISRGPCLSWDLLPMNSFFLCSPSSQWSCPRYLAAGSLASGRLCHLLPLQLVGQFCEKHHGVRRWWWGGLQLQRKCGKWADLPSPYTPHSLTRNESHSQGHTCFIPDRWEAGWPGN